MHLLSQNNSVEMTTVWKVDLLHYNEVDLPTWQAACADIDAAWAVVARDTAQQLKKGPEKGPAYPPTISRNDR